MTESELIALAREYATQRGWPWRDPVRISATTRNREAAVQIETNSGNRGSNIRLVMRPSDGSVLHAAYLPR